MCVCVYAHWNFHNKLHKKRHKKNTRKRKTIWNIEFLSPLNLIQWNIFKKIESWMSKMQIFRQLDALNNVFLHLPEEFCARMNTFISWKQIQFIWNLILKIQLTILVNSILYLVNKVPRTIKIFEICYLFVLNKWMKVKIC